MRMRDEWIVLCVAYTVKLALSRYSTGPVNMSKSVHIQKIYNFVFLNYREHANIFARNILTNKNEKSGYGIFKCVININQIKSI